MIFQIITLIVVIVFCLIMIGHIKEAWYDMTHMDEYRERVAYKKELRQAKKDAINEFRINNTKTGLTIATESLMRKAGWLK